MDLFTGIGGFSIALDDLYRPIVYCDKDPKVHDMLESLMESGKLPRADVIHDVRDVDAILKSVGDRRVDLVTAGFPCTGFSKAGLMQGLHNEGSSLFFSAAKVIKELNAPMAMFENVAEIAKTDDLNEVLDTMSRLGYACRWTICSGLDVHAPQMRRRWFCMCVKAGTTVPDVCLKTTAPAWSVDSMPALVASNQDRYVPRYSMLGNSIIPLAARLAFARLYSGFRILTLQDMMGTRAMTLGEPSAQSMDIAKSGDNGFMQGDKIIKFSIPTPKLRSLLIELDPAHYACLRDTDAKKRTIPGKVVRTLFPTPRATSWRITSALTARSISDLPTFALFASKIGSVSEPKTHEGQKVNVRFVEWLMGVPLDWTSI